MLRAVRCLLGIHEYKLLGMVDKDKVFACKRCGTRYTELYTLRINRLGPPKRNASR
jgi:predicted nucleic-acid-binding Zn-ribbon protein